MKTMNKGPGPAPESSKSLQEDEALSKLVAQDPVLGEVMKMLFGKLEETNKKLDTVRKELDLRRNQVNKLIDAEFRAPEGAQASKLETDHAELEDNGQKVVEDCLGLPAVLRRILEQLSDTELIQLSLVNKSWNFEARSVLRDRGCLTATIASSFSYPDPVCRRLVAFASDLREMRVVPFAGIHVIIDHSFDHYGDEIDSCESVPAGSLHPSYQVILDRLRWKHFSVEFVKSWKDSKDCPALVLVKRILEDNCGVLEELSTFSYQVCSITEFVHSIIQDRSFPCLKTLKVLAWCIEDTAPSAFLKLLVSSAPNLEKFYYSFPAMSEENFMEGSSAVLLEDAFNPFCYEVCEGLIGALRFENMSVIVLRNFNVELLDRFVPMALDASRNSLKTLQMDLLFLVPLISYGICLENVTTLEIQMRDAILETSEEDVFCLVWAFDFTRVFPKLTRIEVKDSQMKNCELKSNDVATFVGRGNAVLRETLQDRSINIKHLELHETCYGNNSTVFFLGAIFPHVTTLSMKTNACWGRFPFTLLWEHFRCLAELRVDFEDSTLVATNLDSAFCGIFPEEVVELREKDDEYLKAVNIVPVMPSITCKRGLRLLTFRYQSSGNHDVEDPNRFITKVTGLIGFSRCPTLSVELQIPSYYSPQVFEHLKPYVPVVTGDFV